MQVLNEEKRKRIQRTAAKMFASQAFHRVRLEDIADAAGVGKGTLYVYFKDKDALYRSILFEGFSDLVDRLRRELDALGAAPVESLEVAIRAIVDFAFQHPHSYELMRSSADIGKGTPWFGKFKELTAIIEGVVKRGVAARLWSDPHPEWTALFLPSLVRAVMLYGTPPGKAETLVQHLSRFMRSGLGEVRQDVRKKGLKNGL